MRLLPVWGDRGRTVVGYTQVDDSDLSYLSQFKWRFASPPKLYVARTMPGQRMLLIHRELMGLEPGDPRQVDHRDRNPLNNKRTNLRITTNAGNAQNQGPARGSSSRHRGVSWSRWRGAWQAYGRLHGKHVFLGYFDDEDKAGSTAADWRREQMPFSEADR